MIGSINRVRRHGQQTGHDGAEVILAVSLRVAEKVTGRETRSGFEVEPDLALVELQTRVEGPPGF